jgi:hypothetical protein
LSRRFIFICASAASLTFAAVGAYANYRNGFVDRLTPEQREIYAYTEFDHTALWREGRCFLRPEQTYAEFARECQQTRSPQDVVVIWGDSHAAALTPGLRVLLGDVVQYTASACPPLIKIALDARPQCAAINDFILGEVGRLQPLLVILHADWPAYGRPDFAQALHATVEGIHLIAPHAKIDIVGAVPIWWPNLPVVLLRRHVRLDGEHFLSDPEYDQLTELDKELQSVALGADAHFVSAIAALCNSGGCQVTVKSNGRFQPMAWDRNHLTEAGSVFLAQKLLDQGSAAP